MNTNIFTALAIVGAMFSGYNATAADMNVLTKDKPVSKVSEINNLDDDSVVYVQGYVVQNLGDDNYLFRDDSGTISVEIDEDLIEGNKIVPNAVVFITATVDKDGNIASLEAEEIDFLPGANNSAPTASNAQ